MNSENGKKYPSLRNNLAFEQRRESGTLPSSSEISSMFSSHKDLSKKLQSKLRMRKKSSNKTDNSLKQNAVTSIAMNLQLKTDPLVELKEKINKEWDENPKVIELVMKYFRYEDMKNMKAQIEKDASFILCQVHKGEKLEDILIRKIERLVKTEQIKEKCKEKENSVLKMLNDRINKLSALGKVE